MKWKASQSIAQNAHAALPKIVEKYFKAGRKAADGKRSPKELHRFRLKTKRFRYTLELFRPVYGGSLERRMHSLHGLQNALGKLSDYETVRQTLHGDKAIQARIERAAKKKLKEFHQLWAEFDADGQLDRWMNYLARAQARTRAAPARGSRRTSMLK